ETGSQRASLRGFTAGCARDTTINAEPAESFGEEFSAISAGSACSASFSNLLIVVLAAQVGDQLLAFQVTEGVFQLHQLDEEIVLGVKTGRVHRTLEVEREPLLDAVHVRALGQVEEQRHVEHDRRRENAVAAEKIDLE